MEGPSFWTRCRFSLCPRLLLLWFPSYSALKVGARGRQSVYNSRCVYNSDFGNAAAQRGVGTL